MTELSSNVEEDTLTSYRLAYIQYNMAENNLRLWFVFTILCFREFTLADPTAKATNDIDLLHNDWMHALAHQMLSVWMLTRPTLIVTATHRDL